MGKDYHGDNMAFPQLHFSVDPVQEREVHLRLIRLIRVVSSMERWLCLGGAEEPGFLDPISLLCEMGEVDL